MKDPGGRPTKYKPEYDQMLIEHLSSGLGYQCFSAIAGIHIDTLYEWERNFPSFSDAKKIGMTRNMLFWERKSIEALSNDNNMNPTVLIFNLKNRFPKQWREKTEVTSAVTHTGKINVLDTIEEE